MPRQWIVLAVWLACSVAQQPVTINVITDKDRFDYAKTIKDAIDSRVVLTCEVFQDEKEAKDLKMCRELTRSTYMGGMKWDGVHAKLQGRQMLKYTNRFGFESGTWATEYDVQSGACLGTGHDGYCRGLYRCKMKEQLFGWLLGAPPFLSTEPQWLGRNNVRDGPQDQVVTCKECLYQPCGFYGCPAGRVTASPAETVAGEVIKLPTCGVACSAGTFLTCKNLAECSYLAYTDANERAGMVGARAWQRANVATYKVDANIMSVDRAAPPVGRCYPCRHAAFLTHYTVVAMTDDSLLERGFLRFRCPGGASAPERCGPSQVTKFDVGTEASSECGCQPGFYLNSTLGRCAPCPAGFFCDWDGMSAPAPRPCPADQFSTGGASACSPCDMGRRCDSGQALTRCKPSAAQPGIFQRENSFCVGCGRCEQLQGGTPTSDAVPCYKVSPKIF